MKHTSVSLYLLCKIFDAKLGAFGKPGSVAVSASATMGLYCAASVVACSYLHLPSWLLE